MQLTASTLGELIKSLRSNEQAGADKRVDPRVGLRARAEIQVPISNERLQIWVRDVSAGGVSILCPRYFELENEFSLILDAEAIESATCRVTHCRRVGSDLYSIGAKFTDYSPKKKSRN